MAFTSFDLGGTCPKNQIKGPKSNGCSGYNMVPASQIKYRARREARAHNVKQFYSTCGKAGCYVSQGGGGTGFRLSGLASDLVKAATKRLMNPVSSYGILGDAIMNAVQPIIDEATGGEKSRLRECANEISNSAGDYAGIVVAADASRGAKLAVGIYAAGKCAQKLLSP